MTKPLQSLTPKALANASRKTIGHYQSSAQDFLEGTQNHDVSQNIDALLRHIQGDSPYDILDLGCGPGRDLLAFRELGHQPVGLDGCAAFVEMATSRTGCTVWHQDFLELELPPNVFDGVFANASLFHVPTQELGRVLLDLYTCLKAGGVLFCSNPRGPDKERFNGDRYGAFLEPATWTDFVVATGFSELEQYYRPEGRPREEQPWFATVWRRPSA